MVRHDELMYPIIPPKYDVGFKVTNCDINILRELEPWCSNIYSNLTSKQLIEYVNKEQPDTQFDLVKRCKPSLEEPKNNIIVEFDCHQLTPQNFQILVNLSSILQESGEVGEMELEIFKFHVKSFDSYEGELINVV
jgi:hypothetical protein